jgi:hypothetical protein
MNKGIPAGPYAEGNYQRNKSNVSSTTRKCTSTTSTIVTSVRK